MKILIVDDDSVVVHSCVRILEAEGIETEVASSVDKAEFLLKAHKDTSPFSLILTDVKMPEKDGFEMIQQARKLQPDIPILMMTGYLTSKTMERGRRFGADNYIAKPFTPDELILAIENTKVRNKGGAQ